MASLLNEHTQYVDDNGKPFVDGFVYIGEQGADPKLNPKTIYSDRELTIPIANPQAVGADGRSVNKIWLDGRYSILVEDLNNNQEYQNLDNGADASSGSTNLVNVIGANDITAEGATTITSYVDKQVYIFTSAQTNTGPITLDIDNVGVKDVTRDDKDPINIGDMVANQNQIVQYNETTDQFQWINTVEVPYVPPVLEVSLLETIDITAPVSTIEFTGLDSYTDYSTFKIIFRNAVCVLANTAIILRFGTGPTPIWDSGSSSYGYLNQTIAFGATVFDANSDASASEIEVHYVLYPDANSSNIGELIFSDLTSAASRTTVRGSSSQVAGTANAGWFSDVSGGYYNDSVVTGIQLLSENGDMTAGTFQLWGYK